MLVEICADSYQSAVNAQLGGADRIELCSELAMGGITPSFGLIEQIIENLNIDVFVLIRPRSGNFFYSSDEFEIMKRDILHCKELGCKGIVSGILMPNFEVDMERTSELVELSKPLEFTFHRAFDLVNDPQKSLVELLEIGVDRVLTSGQQKSAIIGIELLQSLLDLAQNQIKIVPGGGVDLNNAKLFIQAGFHEIHASLSAVVSKNYHPKIQFNSPKFFDESLSYVSDLNKIREMVKICKKE